MTSPEAALVGLLTTGSPNAVVDLVGAGVYADVLPPGAAYPAIRYQLISDPTAEYRDLSGNIGYGSPRYQIDCYALTRLGSITLRDAVLGVLNGYHATVGDLRIDDIAPDEAGSDSYESGIGPDGADVYGRRIDVFIYHAKAQ